jgi:hypothetical protein
MALKSDINMDYSKYDFKDSTDRYIYLSKKVRWAIVLVM